MGLSKTASDAYWLFKKGKKIRTYGKLIKEAIDDDTRSGAIVKLGIRGMLELAGKALGTSLTSHPYFTYHKAHLEALAQALNASSNQDAAKEALNRAIRSADATLVMAGELADIRSQNKALLLTYSLFISGSIKLLRDKDPAAAKQMQDAGLTPQSLQATTDQNVYEWRAKTCELFVDNVQLLAMAQVELRATEAAMDKFNKKMKAMTTGGNIGRIAAYGMEEQRQWQQFDRMTQPGTGSDRAVEDPAGFAADQVNTIEQCSDRLSANCELAMSDDAYNPDLIIHRWDSSL